MCGFSQCALTAQRKPRWSRALLPACPPLLLRLRQGCRRRRRRRQRRRCCSRHRQHRRRRRAVRARALLLASLDGLLPHRAGQYLRTHSSSMLLGPGSADTLTPRTCCAGAVAQPLVSVNFEATTDHNVYRQVAVNGLTFEFGQVELNRNFQAAAYTLPDPLAVTAPNFLRVCHSTQPDASAPVTIAASAGTFTLLSLFAANMNADLLDTVYEDDVEFVGLRNGLAVPGCGPTGATLLNSAACSSDVPCAATQVTFSGCAGIDALQMSVSTANPSTFWCIALDSILVQACSADSSISATAPYAGTDQVHLMG